MIDVVLQYACEQSLVDCMTTLSQMLATDTPLSLAWFHHQRSTVPEMGLVHLVPSDFAELGSVKDEVLRIARSRIKGKEKNSLVDAEIEELFG